MDNHQERTQLRAQLTVAVLAAGALGLSACGGGGGGGGGGSDDTISGATTYEGSTSQVTVESTNGNDAGGSSLDATNTGGGATNLGATSAGVTRETGETGLSLLGATLEGQRLAREHAAGSGNTAAGVSADCPDGGSYSVTSNTGGDSTLNAVGESITASYSNCHFSTVGMDGSITISWNGGDLSTSSYDITVDFTNFLIAQGGTTIYGANGAVRMRSGSQTNNFPTGHDGAYAGAADLEINLGDGGTIDVVDNVRGRASRVTDGNLFFSDGDNSGTLDTTGNWYMAAHGSPMETCTDQLGGCVTVDHTVTTSFTFTAGSTYPATGIWKVDGSSGSVTLDANTGDSATVNVTINGVGPTEENWSSLTSRSFASDLN